MQPISKIIDGRRVIVKKPELLAPAGNLEKLKTAIIYGADAVFIGGKEFSLRSQASNFSIEDIKELIREKELQLGLSCFASPNMTNEDFGQEANNLEQMLEDTGFSMQCSMMRLLSDDIFNEISTYQDFSNVCNRVNPAEDIWDLQYNVSLNYK